MIISDVMIFLFVSVIPRVLKDFAVDKTVENNQVLKQSDAEGGALRCGDSPELTKETRLFWSQ